MNKEILFAILITSFIIVNTFTTVAIENNISRNLIEKTNLTVLLTKINVLIKKISYLYGYIPIVSSLCNRIIGILDTIGLFMFCAVFGLFVAIPLAILMLILFFSGITNTYLGQVMFYILFSIFFIWDYNCNFITFPVNGLWEYSIKPIFSIKNSNNTLKIFKKCPCLEE